MGFPVDNYRPGRNEDPQAGCPFGEDVPAWTQRLVAESLEGVISLPIKEDARSRRSAVVTHLPVEGLQIKIRACEGTKEVVSCMLQQSFKFTESGELIVVDLPRLDEGDVMLLK